MEAYITNLITNPADGETMTVHNIGEAPLHLSSIALGKGERIIIRQTKRGLKRQSPSGNSQAPNILTDLNSVFLPSLHAEVFQYHANLPPHPPAVCVGKAVDPHR